MAWPPDSTPVVAGNVYMDDAQHLFEEMLAR
jgi:hypothetical protein